MSEQEKEEYPNDEWELHELMESFSSELDRFEDTLSFKAYGRGITFGLTSLNLELHVFVRFDSKTEKWFFKSAKPGEAGASTLKLDLPSLLRDEIHTHGKRYELYNATPVSSLPDIKKVQIFRLARLGIFTVGDLKTLSISPELRNVVIHRAQIDEETLAGWLKIPYIREIKPVDNELLIVGRDFLDLGYRGSVIIEGKAAEVLEWSVDLIRVKIPKGVKAGSLVVRGDQVVSNRVLFRTGADLPGRPVQMVRGIGRVFAQRLTEAGIDTVEKLLEIDPDSLSGILKASRTRVLNILEAARKGVFDKA